ALMVLLAGLIACSDVKTPAFVDCAVSPDTLDFRAVSVSSSAGRTFTVTNGGTESMEASIRPPCGDFTTVGTSSVSIPRGGSHTFTLRFTPKATGPRPCRISIADCGVLTTTGQGLPGNTACVVAPTSLALGTVTVGSTADDRFTITNTGDTQLSGTVQESCAEFSL